MNLYGHYLDPGWQTCLACPADDCHGTDSPTCPRHGLPSPAVGLRTVGDLEPATPFPAVLSAPAVATRSGCRHCLAMTDCAASVNAGGPCLCERCGWAPLGQERRLVEV